MELTQQVALVTGGSRGIGAAIVSELLAADATVYLTARHVPSQEQTAIFNAISPNWHALTADVTDADAMQQVIKQIVADAGQLTVVVNNAGITQDQLLLRMTPADFARPIEVNLQGAFNVLQPALKQMYRQKAGVIINMASVVGLHGNLGQANYAASKAGLIGLTKTAAQEGALRGIRCNAVAPGMIATEMTANLSAKVQDQLLAKIPLGRFGQPAEVAAATMALITNDYLTGQVLTVDGGLTI